MNFFLSIFLFIILYFFFKYISKYLGLIDHPNSRKNHKGNIPLIGGLIIYFNIFFFMFLFDASYYFSVIFYTSSILLILGAIDDSRELGVTFRLVSQLISCLIIVGSGLVITNIGDYGFLPNIKIGILSTIFTVFCVIGLTNSFNFIDGVDGLCGGLFLISLSTLLIFAYISQTYYLFEDLELILILLITIILFLIFNMSSKFKIFLGDSGSMTLGFIMAWFLILYTQVYQVIHPVLAMWCVTLTTFDIITVVIRRILRNKNPFKPDRRHIHHLLLDRGGKHYEVTITILIIASLFNMLGIFTLHNYGPLVSLSAYFFLFIAYFLINIKLSRK